MNEIKMLHALNLPGSTTLSIYMQGEKILKAAKVAIGSASSKVVSPIMDKMESLPLEGVEGCIKCGGCLSYYSWFYYMLGLF